MSRRPLPAATPRKAADQELSDLGARVSIRFGLAVTFMVPVAGVLTIVIIAMGFVVYGSAAEAMEDETNRQGIFAARIAASPELGSWLADYNTSGDLYSRLGRLETEAGLPIEAGQGPPEAVVRNLQERDTRQRAFNRQRLESVIGSAGALDLQIRDAKGNRVANAVEAAFWREGQAYTYPSSPDTTITSGTFGPAPDDLEPARFFRHPIRAQGDQIVGHATVVFSERGLLAGLNRLRNAIVLTCVLAIVACVLVSWIVARSLTRPLVAVLGDIRRVAAGDLAHRIRIRSHDEIGVVAGALDHMTQNLAAAEVMRRSLAEKEHQVGIVQEVQERLFPETLPEVPGLSIEAANRVPGDLSADLFDAVVLPDGAVGCLVMTASGGGLPAAIVLSMARVLFRSTAAASADPAQALQALNRALTPDLRSGMYVTALYAVLQPASGDVNLVSAGHRVPALHFVAEAGGLRRLAAEGLALGIDVGPVFDRSLVGASFRLEPGDRLILAGDGLLDGHPEENLMRTVLRACRQGLGAEELAQAVDTGATDVTVVVATRTG